MPQAPREFDDIDCAFGAERIARALDDVDVIVKSPGVSLYRREIETARRNGVKITSLLNLWFAERIDVTTICVTGTKGKSTTASLIAHMLGRLGRRVALAGNIGVPITEIDPAKADYAVIEVSSYQAADFDGICDMAVLTSLFPEHIDWHRTLAAYYRDKLNLLRHSRQRDRQPRGGVAIGELALTVLQRACFFNDESGVHRRGPDIFDGRRPDRRSPQSLPRPGAQCLESVCGADRRKVARHRPCRRPRRRRATLRRCRTASRSSAKSAGSCLSTTAFRPHLNRRSRRFRFMPGRDITVIVGGYDRGIDYGKLVATLAQGVARAVICLGASGERIYAGLRAAAAERPEASHHLPGAVDGGGGRLCQADDAGGRRRAAVAGGAQLWLLPRLRRARAATSPPKSGLASGGAEVA